jgi:alkyldihydroxyacetonephosphate synthase
MDPPVPEEPHTTARRPAARAGSLIIPERLPPPGPSEAESLDVWGFQDTRFDINASGNVIIRGSRYELSGKELPRFLPWVREMLKVDVGPQNINRPAYPTAIPEPNINAEFLLHIQGFLAANQIETSGEVRMRHGHGHTQEEMYSIKYTRLGRIPDLVVYPDDEDQVGSLVEAGKSSMFR